MALLTIMVAGWYVWAFVLPRSVSFAYAGSTCRSSLVLFPQLHRQDGSAAFSAKYADGWRIGSTQLLTTSVCFAPKAAPAEGESVLRVSPLGVPLFRTAYRVAVGEPPTVVSSLKALSTSATKPIKLVMSKPDETYQYYVSAQDKSQRCEADHAVLVCGLDKLGLEQGAQHKVAVARSFGQQSSTRIAEASVHIVPAAQVVDTSIKQDAIVYEKPKQLKITIDKPLAAATATLTRLGAASEEPVEIKTAVSGSTVTVSWEADLPREQDYKLTLAHVDASDGSTLSAPYELRFKTSGPPKVVAVSIGAGGVAPRTRVVVTFDQPLLVGSNIVAHASIAGGTADITMQGDRQIVFALREVPLCGAFTLRVAAGLVGQNGLITTQDWSMNSRLTCRAATEVIGNSVNGRPITAYYYGSGDTTILFTGGIHGSEPSGTYLMQDWVEYLDKNASQIPAGRRVVVVPNLNPDGIATRNRYNAHNVNLDRNFDSSDWASDIDTGKGILQGGGGAVPFSEPESVAIANLTTRLKPRLVMSYHARGSLVGMNDVADARAIGSVYAGMVGYGMMFDNTEAVMGYTLTGEYETWLGETLGAPAVLIELPGYDGRYFNAHLNALWKMVGI